MNINAVNNAFTLNRLNDNKTTQQNSDFKQVFSNILEQTVQNDVADQAENMKFMAGESDDTHNTLIAAEKADISLLLTVQIRNKIIDAYNEIMRMQL